MRFLIKAYALIWAFSATASSQALGKPPLSLNEAIASVLESNPQLQAADFDTQAAAARIRQQSQPTPWKLGVELENLGGTSEVKGIQRMETTLSLGRILELGNKPQLRGELARVQATLLANEQDAQRLDLLAETLMRFHRIAQVQALQRLAEERVVLKQRTLKTVDRHFKLGKAPKAERSRAEIDLARAELELEETEHQFAVARRNLATLWGEFSPDFQSVEADLYQLESVPDQASLERLVEKNPSLVLFATQQRLAEARVRLAEATREPDIEMSGGIRHLNGSDDFGLLFSVRVPLGSRNRATPWLEETAALSAREPLLALDKRLALRATLFGLRQELIHNRDVINALQDRIIPAAQSALADYNRGYVAGRYSLLELTQSQSTLLQARIEALNAAFNYQRNRTEIDRLTGGAIHRISNTGVSQ